MGAAMCDVCSCPTSWEEGTGYTADEFRRMVSKGLGPDEKMITMQETFGTSRQQAISDWKNGLVAQSTTGWLLCPTCASRASNYIPKTAGTGPAGHVLTETFSMSGSSSPGTSWTPKKKWWQNKAKLLPVGLLLVAILMITVLFISRTGR